MMKKLAIFLLTFSAMALVTSLSAADPKKATAPSTSTLEEDDEDSTDIFAIPLDDSEEEEREEMEEMQKIQDNWKKK